MIIDVFRDRKIFEDLQRHNESVQVACSKVTFAREGEDYDLPNNKVSYWFDPSHLRDLHLSHDYPNKSYYITNQSKFNLLLYFPNYISLYLINLLYQGRTNVLIEDMAAGMGRLVFFLHRAGFRNFHITEKFTQLSHYLLDEMMKEGNIEYQLNVPETKPVIINLCGWTHITRNDFPSSIELACFYNQGGELVTQESGSETFFVIGPERGGLSNRIAMRGFVFLCQDIDNLTRIFCRQDKYEEFSLKLSQKKVII